MLTNLYAVYDEKAAAYLNPFFLATDGIAVRAITDALDDENHQFTKHPEDFTLYRLAIFDDSDASLLDKKEVLGTILEFKSQRENKPTLTEVQTA